MLDGRGALAPSRVQDGGPIAGTHPGQDLSGFGPHAFIGQQYFDAPGEGGLYFHPVERREKVVSAMSGQRGEMLRRLRWR